MHGYGLLDRAAGMQLDLFPPPQSVPSNVAATEISYSLLDGGVFTRPNGLQPREFSLSGFFPGGSSYGQPWAPPGRWRPPKDLAFQLNQWMIDRTILQFVVGSDELLSALSAESAAERGGDDGWGAGGRGIATARERFFPPPGFVDPLYAATDINVEVYVSAFGETWGTRDHLFYTLTLKEARPFYITPAPPEPIEVSPEPFQATAGAPSTIENAEGEPQTDIKPSRRHVVVKDEDLTDVAKIEYGAATQDNVQALFDANKDPIIPGYVSMAQIIEEGWELIVPGGTTVSTITVSP